MFFYAKDRKDYLINKRKEVGLKYLKDPKVFIKYSSNKNDVYRSIGNPGKKNPGKKKKTIDGFLMI